MAHRLQLWLPCLVTLLVALNLPNSQALLKNENRVKSAVFLSPEFVLGPGSVVDKIYYNIDFPKGHIAVKDFYAEVVDEAGNSVPLYETYLHHWVVYPYYQRKGVEVPKYNSNSGFSPPDLILLTNSGPCENNALQYFGLGSETRKTATYVPDPYGIEVGNPAKIPPGYELQWLINIHAIDTRGVEDRMGCTECRRDLYNVTKDGNGRPLSPDYVGGWNCCYDMTQCRVREGFGNAKRSLFMRYKVTWVEWDISVVPVKIYIFDVTDTWNKSDASRGLATKHHCPVEFDVESCSAAGVANGGCIYSKRVTLTVPTGGDVIYGVAHQHAGGIGSTLFREDGQEICSSLPTYGEGKEPGNEAGYIVGMSACYPRPGSVKLSDGETIAVASNYSQGQMHTGVMGLFYILVADASPKPNTFLKAPVEKLEEMALPISLWGVALFGVAIAITVVVAYRKRSAGEDGYQSIGM